MLLPRIELCTPAVFCAYYVDIFTPPICIAFLGHEEALYILARIITDPERSATALKLSHLKTMAMQSSLFD